MKAIIYHVFWVTMLLCCNVRLLFANTIVNSMEYKNDVLSLKLLAGEGNFDEFTQKAQFLDQKWQQKDVVGHCQIQLEICNVLSTQIRHKDIYQVKSTYAESALQAIHQLDDPNIIPLYVEFRLFYQLIPGLNDLKQVAASEEWGLKRKQYLNYYCKTLSRLEQQKDPTWDPNFLSTIIPPSPPESVKLWVEGASLAQIKDPIAREKYKSEKEIYNEQLRLYQQQFDLRKMENENCLLGARAIRRLYSEPGFYLKQNDRTALLKDLKACIPNPVLRNRIYDEVMSVGQNLL